jgi:hypothetical protein
VLSPRCQERRLVGQIRQVGADHPRRGRGHGGQVDVVAERHRPGVDLEDLQAAGLAAAAIVACKHVPA